MTKTGYTIIQDGTVVGSTPHPWQAVSSARLRAKKTGHPVSVVCHYGDHDDIEAIFNQDGTNEKIWAIDPGRQIAPEAGRVYHNRAGGFYECTGFEDDGPEYFNAGGGCSKSAAYFRNIESGWAFLAHGIVQYIDGTVEWGYSTSGHFEEATT